MFQAKTIVVLIGIERVHFVSVVIAQYLSAPVMDNLEYRSAVCFSKQGFHACRLTFSPIDFELLIKNKNKSKQNQGWSGDQSELSPNSLSCF